MRPPFDVQFHHDPKNKFNFAEKTPDDEWMSKVGAEGWIVFSHDRKWHTELPVCAAIKQHGVGCFYLWGAQMPLWDKMVGFLRSYVKIANHITNNKKPYIFYVNHQTRVFEVKIPTVP